MPRRNRCRYPRLCRHWPESATGVGQRYDLQPTPYHDLVGWGVGDFLFHQEADNITSTVKIRQAGFADALDTETRLLELSDQPVEQKVLPPLR